ncbi:MAG: hypothetical protein PHR77_07450 [Kiritimatiellae bacterium]|nr:hypothetical protein [Kiritimatiellia bacterium]MDD5522631.1 hypothetical protein [Kiritimatiellia bacterium]
MRLRLLSGIIAVFMTYALCFAQTSKPSTTAGDEKSIWEIWKIQQEKPDEHGTITTNCLEYAKKAPTDPLSLVTLTIASWHMLEIDNKDAAVKLLKTVLSSSKTDALSTAAANMAKAWMTRIEMEQMKQALQLYYRKNIEYPKSIDLVKPFQKNGQPPLTDQWGKPWVYGLAEFKSLKKLGAMYGMYGQKYTIRSVYLGTNSELKVALKIPYASGMPLKPVKMLNGMPGKEMVQLESTDGKQTKVVLSIGTESSGITLNYAGPKLLILSDMNHWLVVPRPY